MSPNPPIPSPWCLLLAPALSGDQASTLDAIAQAEGRCADADLPTTMAVAARALFAVGRPDEAERRLDRALDMGSAAATALATLVRPEGARWGRARLSVGGPGDRADAACDLAWLSVRSGHHADAQAWVDEALGHCPEHAEAAHWKRSLVDAPALAWRHPRDVRAGADASDLSPSIRQGWLSAERWLRRVSGGAWLTAAPHGSALARLHMSGTATRLLACDSDYASLPDDHLLVDCERALDLADALEREGRCIADSAQTAWRIAGHIDDQAVHDTAQALVALGVRAPGASRVGLSAAEVLTAIEPDVPLWQAYRARLLAEQGHRQAARRAATRTLAQDALEPVAFTLAIETLRRLGAHQVARRHAITGLCSAGLAGTAAQLLVDWEHPSPMHPMVTDRLSPRMRAEP